MSCLSSLLRLLKPSNPLPEKIKVDPWSETSETGVVMPPLNKEKRKEKKRKEKTWKETFLGTKNAATGGGEGMVAGDDGGTEGPAANTGVSLAGVGATAPHACPNTAASALDDDPDGPGASPKSRPNSRLSNAMRHPERIPDYLKVIWLGLIPISEHNTHDEQKQHARSFAANHCKDEIDSNQSSETEHNVDDSSNGSHKTEITVHEDDSPQSATELPSEILKLNTAEGTAETSSLPNIDITRSKTELPLSLDTQITKVKRSRRSSATPNEKEIRYSNKAGLDLLKKVDGMSHVEKDNAEVHRKLDEVLSQTRTILAENKEMKSGYAKMESENAVIKNDYTSIKRDNTEIRGQNTQVKAKVAKLELDQKVTSVPMLKLRKRTWAVYKHRKPDGTYLEGWDSAIGEGNEFAHEGFIKADVILYRHKLAPDDKSWFFDWYGIYVLDAEALDDEKDKEVIESLNARATHYISQKKFRGELYKKGQRIINIINQPGEARNRACKVFMNEYQYYKQIIERERKARVAAERELLRPLRG